MPSLKLYTNPTPTNASATTKMPNFERKNQIPFDRKIIIIFLFQSVANILQTIEVIVVIKKSQKNARFCGREQNLRENFKKQIKLQNRK